MSSTRARSEPVVSCAGCGSLVAATARFCPGCGAPIVGARPPSASRPAWVVPVVGVVLVAAAAALVWTFVFRGSGSGSSSPERAVEEFAEAVNGDDPLLIVQAVAPSEVDATADLLVAADERLSALGITLWRDDAPSEFDVEIDLDSVSVVERSDDVALVEVDGEAHVDGIGVPAPLQLVIDESYDVSLDELRQRLEEEGAEAVGITTVYEDGRWYVSLVRTVAALGVDAASVLPELSDVGLSVEDALGAATDAVDVLADWLDDDEANG